MENSSASNNLSGPLSNTSFKGFMDLPVYELSSVLKDPAITIPLYFPLSNKFNALVKRTFDIVISILIVLLVLSWLLPVLALIIWIDSSGPIFFLQRRTKSLGQEFTCIKLRTMLVNTEADILSATENDYRITKVGKLLRKYHIDELPQFMNVLAGDMSVIGPRPHMIIETSRYECLLTEYSGRHAIKPGITGLAQSFGHFGATEDLDKMKYRVYLDLKYIREWSLIMDITILLRTCALILGMPI